MVFERVLAKPRTAAWGDILEGDFPPQLFKESAYAS
jgi:hypothetical protein